MLLSKTEEAGDLTQMPEALEVVRRFGTAGQTPEAREWEYCQALRAIERHVPASVGVTLIDVGGADSDFYKMATAVRTLVQVEVLDPQHKPDRRSLEDFVHHQKRTFDIVTCLSVLEHVPELESFVYHLSCLTAPGGLLALTFDCIGHDSGDHAHFHWDRKRIFGPSLRAGLLRALRELQFSPLGDVSSLYPANTLYDSYAVASLVVVKRS